MQAILCLEAFLSRFEDNKQTQPFDFLSFTKSASSPLSVSFSRQWAPIYTISFPTSNMQNVNESARFRLTGRWPSNPIVYRVGENERRAVEKAKPRKIFDSKLVNCWHRIFFHLKFSARKQQKLSQRTVNVERDDLVKNIQKCKKSIAKN